MILSRAPVRITLGGGGTDLKSYYSKHGGFLIAAGVSRYCSIIVEKRFKGDFRLAYSETENIDKVEQVRHNIFREAIKYIGIIGGIELHSISNVPSSSGLGSSSSFTVALLNALHTYKKEFITQRELASEACHIEIDILKEPIGKQDQYMAAFGGLTCLKYQTRQWSS
jgi:D-glycero-alpha-D-manno-heptose-7-phosphate kinase